jgi:hypothetical protein
MVRPEPAHQGASLARKATASGACVANPTVVVSDEASLDNATETAQPGAIIAIQGTIALHLGLFTETPDVTFTCATPGSGLSLAVDADDDVLIYPFGDRDVIQGLALDASGGLYALYTENTDGQRAQFNNITCGDTCGFWVGTTNATISDNVVIQPHAGTSGLHFQGMYDATGALIRGIDGTRIERNTITATTPTALPPFGAIRPRDGTGITVADNVISGPWSNGISLVSISASSLTKNVVTGPARFGFVVNIAGAKDLTRASGNALTANRVTDAGTAGFSLDDACFNVFHGNPSLGSTPVAFILGETTGGNTVAGTAGASIDHGAADCDGDGQIDPNTVSGQVSHNLIATGAALNANIRAGARVARSSSAHAGARVLATVR